MRIPTRFALPLALVAAAVAAACGPATPPTMGPQAGPNPAPAEPAPTAAPSAQPSVEPAPPTPAPIPPPPPESNSTKIAASKLAAEVKKLGIGFDKKLAALPLPQKKKVMPLFVKALGYDGCNGCHVEGDFKQETRNLKVARQMWDHFVVSLRDSEGAPIFCDSCHGGKAKVLDRANPDGMKKFMMEEYTAKLVRADKNMHGCASCHGDQKELRIIAKLWGIAAK
jgi:hypothetical protein